MWLCGGEADENGIGGPSGAPWLQNGPSNCTDVHCNAQDERLCGALIYELIGIK